MKHLTLVSFLFPEVPHPASHVAVESRLGHPEAAEQFLCNWFKWRLKISVDTSFLFLRVFREEDIFYSHIIVTARKTHISFCCQMHIPLEQDTPVDSFCCMFSPVKVQQFFQVKRKPFQG